MKRKNSIALQDYEYPDSFDDDPAPEPSISEMLQPCEKNMGQKCEIWNSEFFTVQLADSFKTTGS